MQTLARLGTRRSAPNSPSIVRRALIASAALVTFALLTACGDDITCMTHHIGMYAASDVTCSGDPDGMRLTVTAGLCSGAPSSCSFSLNGSTLEFDIGIYECKDESTDDTGPTGCPRPPAFDCIGPKLEPGTYDVDRGFAITVAQDGRCVGEKKKPTSGSSAAHLEPPVEGTEP